MQNLAVLEPRYEKERLTHHTHALPSSEKGCNANEQTQKSQCPPTSVGGAESNDDAIDDSSDDAADSESSGKRLSWGVAITDGPANEIRVGLVPKRPFDRCNDITESRRMGGNGQRLEHNSPFLCG